MQIHELMINRIGSIDQHSKISRQTNDMKQKGDNFAAALNDAIDTVAHDQKVADEDIKGLLAGDQKNIHRTMINLEKADISLRLMTKVRDKVIDAYREMMRMNV